MANRFARAAPVVVGALLLLESVAVLFVAMFTAVVGGLVGALAFGVSAGSATSRQLAETTVVMVASLASPFLVALVLAAGGTFLLLRRGKSVVIGAGVVALVAQVVFHFVVAEGFHTA